MKVTVDVPEQYLLEHSPETLANELRLAYSLILFRQGKVSMGAACELAGIDRYGFLTACREHGIPAVKYSTEDLDAEVEWLNSLLSLPTAQH